MSTQVNFRDEILKALLENTELAVDIQAFVIENDKPWNGDPEIPWVPVGKDLLHRPLDWKRSSKWLNFETFNDYFIWGFYPVRVYTVDFIYYIEEDDGKFIIKSIERNPS